jgi:hypothetical protein
MGRQRRLADIQWIAVHHSADNSTPDQLIRERARRNEGYNVIVQDVGGPNDKQVKVVQDAPDTEVSNGTYGVNLQTLNVVVPGNFELKEPTPDQIWGLIQVIAAKAKALGWRKRDVTRISYHQYLGRLVAPAGYRYGTACPGANIIKRMPEIRQQVARYLRE